MATNADRWNWRRWMAAFEALLLFSGMLDAVAHRAWLALVVMGLLAFVAMRAP